MKLLISTLVALTCLGANAAANHKIPTVQFQKGIVMPMALGESYFGPVAVGRIDAFNYTVELVGLTVTEDGSSPVRKVKAVLDLSPTGTDADPDWADQVEAAQNSVRRFYEIKRGKAENCNGGGSCEYELISKLTGVIFDSTTMTNDQVSCMGLDLEVLDQPVGGVAQTTKKCFKIRPTHVVEYAL